MAKVLIIDDDDRLAEMVGTYLSGRGLQVAHRADGRTGLQALEDGGYDAVLLDVMLPDFDGFEICRRIRATDPHIGIVMLTARGEPLDRIVGLELGADDYVPKPFDPRELLARLNATLRRVRVTPAEPDTELLRVGEVTIDRGRLTVAVEGRPELPRHELTSHQFALLVALAERAGRVQTRDQLMEAVRGEPLQAFDRSIDVHVSRIRAAIEDDPRHPRIIKTVRGVGYLMTRD